VQDAAGAIEGDGLGVGRALIDADHDGRFAARRHQGDLRLVTARPVLQAGMIDCMTMTQGMMLRV
jgi:hypothetical protein